MSQPNTTLHSWMGRLAGLVLLSVLFFPVGAASALGATSTGISLHSVRSADCSGEDVEINGTIHMLNQVQTDGSVIGHFNYQNVRAVGLTSGNTYQTSAVNQFRLSAPFPSTISSAQSFRLISRGSGSNLLVMVLYHITVNANGEVTATIDSLTTQCTP